MKSPCVWTGAVKAELSGGSSGRYLNGGTGNPRRWVLGRKLAGVPCVTRSPVLPDEGLGCARELCIGLFVHLLVIHLFLQHIPTAHLRGIELGVEDGQDQIPALQGLSLWGWGQEQEDSDLL